MNSNPEPASPNSVPLSGSLSLSVPSFLLYKVGAITRLLKRWIECSLRDIRRATILGQSPHPALHSGSQVNSLDDPVKLQGGFSHVRKQRVQRAGDLPWPGADRSLSSRSGFPACVGRDSVSPFVKACLLMLTPLSSHWAALPGPLAGALAPSSNSGTLGLGVVALYCVYLPEVTPNLAFEGLLSFLLEPQESMLEVRSEKPKEGPGQHLGWRGAGASL